MILCGHRARRRLRRRACLEDATFCWRGSGRPRPLELRPSATADSTSNKPPRAATGHRRGAAPSPVELSRRMCFVVMMVSCAVIFISASEVSGVGGRCDLVFSVVWLSKNWISMRFVRAVFAFFCGDCPVFSTLTKAKATLPTKLGWSGARAVMVVVV